MREPAHPHPGHSNTQMLPKISTRIQRKTQGMEQNVFGQTLPDLSIKKNYKALFGPKQTPQKVFNCVVKAIVEHIIREKKDTIKKNRSAFNRRKNITTLHFAKDTHTCVRSTFYNDNDINLLDILSKETTTRKVQAKIIKKLPRKKKTVQVRRTIAKIKPITRLRKKAGETFAVPGTSAIPKFLPSNAFEPEKMDTTTTPSPKKTTIHTPTTPSPKKIPIDTSTKGTIPDNSTVKEPMDTTANTTPSGNTPNKISTPKQVTTPNQITTPPALPKTPTKTVEKAGSGVTLDDVPISVKKNITILIPEKAMLPTLQNALPETEDAATLLAKKIISTTEANVNMQPMLDTETSGSVIAKKQFEAAEKIKFLKKEGLWSQDQLPICNEPYRGKAHQDFMLEEMTWMYKDFTLERKRKQGMAALICKELRKLFKQRDALEERKLNSEVQEAIKHHAKVAKLIRTFWQEAYQVVQHKESCILDLARRRAREERLRQTVAKANTMTQMVCESMNTDGLLEDYETESEDEEKASRSVLEEADSEIAALQKEENEDISELMRKYYPGFVENMANESRVEESEDDEPPPVKRPRRATAKESTKETAKEVVAPSPAQTPSKNNNKVQEAIENNGEKLSELSEELKTLQPKGFTLDSSEIIVKQPTFIKGTLREYQLLGLNWLVTLYNRKLNAILADEMGLGKTLQTIALLAHMALEEKNWGPHLIVVPTSVILNWEMEFKKWCPEFKILTYFGNAKERQEKRKGWTKENAFNVVITSYKIATNDIKSFRKRQWQYYILDEAHTIKNSKSQRWQQLLNVKAMRRLLLTGTPLQNNLMELWSLMHFLMPSMFGSQEDFQNVFNDPLQDMASMNSDQNKDLITKLHDVLRPFLLRRLKKDVEKQLPTKREEVVYCNLSTRQRYLYEDFMDRRETQQNLASGSVFSVLNIVMQLRKCCNHPNLFEKRQTESPFVCYDIKKFYPGVIMDLVEKNKMVTGVSESLIFNNGAMNSSAVKESLRQLKMTKQQFKENEEGRQLKNLPKVSGFKFHNPIQTHFESIQFVRQNMVEGQKVLTAEINVNNMAKLNLSYSDEFILSFDDTYVDRLPFFVTDKKPILVRIDIDPHTQMPAIFLVNKDDIIMPTKLRQFQFARNYQNNFVLIKRHDPANLNLKKFIKPPTNILTTTSRTAINPTKLHQNLRTNVQTSRVTKNFIPAPYLPVSKSKGGREEENYVGSDSVLPVLEIEEDELMDTSIYQAIEAEVGANEQFLSNLSVSRIDRLQNSYVSSELLRFINRSANSSTYIQKDDQFVVSYNHCNTELNSEVIIFDPVQKFVDYNMDYFGIYTYPAISNRCIVETIGRGRLPDVVQALNDVQIEATDKFSELSETFHQVRLSKMFSFPELRLIEYDCGKLQKMAELLRNLYLNKHRVLIFTQMSKMLDILQVFLSYHGYQYFRLDGTTGIEQRQCMTERFNTDPKIFCFILSTRSGGVGINLTGADTVIFYDTDWNPTMDAQAEDRCHRIGQAKNVTVYRLISHHTIEENIYQKAQVKKRLGQIAIDNAGFTPDFFKDTSNIRDLFKDNKGKIDINPNEEMTQEELIQAMAANEDELDVVAAKKAALEVERIQSDENEDFNGAILSDDPILNEELEELTMGLTKAERYAVLKMEQECKAEFEERLKETIAYEKQHQTSDDTMEGQNDGTDLFEELQLLDPEAFDRIPIWCPLSPPSSDSYIMEDIYIDSSQAYHTQIMHEKYLPTTIYEWPKQVTRQRYDTTLRIETNPYTQSTIEDLLRQTSNYSPSLSVASTAEPSPNFFNDGPQPSPLVTDPTIDKYEIGGTYEALKNITICCARPYLSQPHVKLDFNKAVRPAMVMYDQRYPYDEPKDFESIQWNIVEEHALLMAVVRDQNIRWVDLGVEREHDYVNWLYVAQCVNRIGTTYKSPKQCYIRYVHNIIPREMGKTTVYCCFQRKNRKVNVSGSESQFVKRHGRMKTHAYFMQDAKKTLKVGTAAETKAMIQTKMRQYSDYTNVSRYCDKDKNVVDPHLDSAHLTSYFQAKTPMSVQNLFDDTFHTNDNVNSMLIETKKLAEIEQRKIYENCIGESKRFLKEFKVVGVNKPCLKRVGIISVKENEPGLTGIHEPTVMRAKFSDPSEMERGYRQGQNPLKRPAPGGPIAPITTPQPVAMGGASQMQYRNQNFVGNPNARYPSTNESNVASPQRRVPHQQPRPQPSGPYPGESFNYSNQPSNYMPTNPNIPVVRPQFGTGRKVAPRPVGTAVYNNQPNQQPQTYMRPKHAASFSQEGGGQAPYMLVNANSGQHVQLPPGHNGRVIENRVKAGPTRTLYNAPTAGPPRGPPHPSIKTFKHPSLMLNEPGPSKIGVRGGGVTKKGAQKNTSNPETIIKMNMNLSKGSTIKPPAPRTTLPNRTSRNVAMPMGPVQSSMRQLGMDGSTMGGPSPGQAFTTNYNRNPVPSVPSRQGPGPYSQTQGNRRPHQDLTPSKNQDPNK